MKIKNRWFASVENFISTIEFGALDEFEGEEEEYEKDLDGYEPVDLTRGEFETAIHASNILRGALRKKIPNDVIIKTEFMVKGDNHKMDLVLCGKKKSKIIVGILEFKQWSKIEQDAKSGTFSANKFRDKIESFEFGKEGCPSHQLTNYRELIEKQMPNPEIQTALIFPNLTPGDGKKFIDEVKSAGAHEIFTLDDLDMAAKTIAEWFDDGCKRNEIPFTRTHKVPNDKIQEFVKNIKLGSTTHFPQPKTERHGWVGSVRDFIRHCEHNTLATIEVKTKSTAEQRSIMFSCNFLAMELRKLADSKPEIMDFMSVIVEFGMILSAHRIDAVLAVCEDSTPESLRLMAIEMKAWSNEEMNQKNRMSFAGYSEFDDNETDVAKNHNPAIINYTVGAGNTRTSRHPVEQVRTYMQELESEYAEGVSGCAWLHNVPNKLSGIMNGLVEKGHVCTWSQGRNYKTIFQSHRGEPVPLLTRRQSYTAVKRSKPSGIREQIEEWLTDRILPFTQKAMDRICEGNPQLSSYCINQAFDYAEHILDEKEGPLDDDQREIAKEIIAAYQGVIDGSSSTSTVFSIEGDAGTGKTFIALAVIGYVLKMLHDEGGEIRLKQLPRLVCCNNPASDAIAQNCRMAAGSEEVIKINPSFMINRQNFNANSQYFLANALETICEGESPPAILIFDESQLLAGYTDAQMVALGEHKSNTKFLTWLDKEDLRSHSYERKNLKSDVSVLTMLAPITVFFADPKQATRVKAINNITRENLKQHCKTKSYDYVEKALKKSYRSEEAYLALLRDVLYNSNEKPPKPEGGFELSIVDTEKEFVNQFQNRMASSVSCGMVAGYTKEWKSSGAETAHELENKEVDWTIGSEEFHWNLSPGRTWIFSADQRKKQIGYYLAIQGNELDELFVYIGEDMVWGMKEQKVLAQMDKHQPKSECKKFPGASDDDIKRCIINQYWVLLTRAKKSCTVYCVDDQLSEIFKKKSLEYGYLP